MLGNFFLGVLFGALLLFAPAWALLILIIYLLLPRQ